MINALCIIGHPSYCGGADTELHDQIKCWHKMGIKLFICHTGPLTDSLVKKMDLQNKYGVTYLRPRQWNDVQGMHCISFCNGEFLSNLRHIRRHAKTTTFVNCMTWNFQKEIECQFKGLIDFHLYQTQHAMDKVSKNLQHLGVYHPILFKPFFDTAEFPFIGNRLNDHFRFGRISRCDPTKYHNDQMNIYDSIDSSIPKSGVILGWDFKIKDLLKVPNNDLSIQTHNDSKSEFYKGYIQLLKEGAISQQQFYKFCDVMITASNTFENLPRVGFESMSSGSVLVVNNRGGWTIQIEDGKTGFLCNSTQEFIERSTFLAKNPDLKEEIRRSARLKLEQEWGIEESMKSWENVFTQLSKV